MVSLVNLRGQPAWTVKAALELYDGYYAPAVAQVSPVQSTACSNTAVGSCSGHASSGNPSSQLAAMSAAAKGRSCQLRGAGGKQKPLL
jgi:hypothetical protein